MFTAPKDKPIEAQKDALEVQIVTGSTLPVTNLEALQTLFRTRPEVPPQPRTPSVWLLQWCPLRMLPLFPWMFLTNVLVTHPHVVALIGVLEATFSTAMEDSVATHMSPIHEGIHTSSFMERGAFGPRK